MDIEMEYVYAVYQERSFSKAAQKMFVSQSAVSAMVRKAEASIGCQIFDRSTIPFSVTEEGRFYLDGIEKIKSIERNMNAFFNDANQLNTGHLSVGSSSFYCAYFLARMVKAFKKKYPGVHIDIREGGGLELRQWLLDETIDFLFGATLSDDPDFQRTLFTQEHLVLGVPAEYSVNEKLKNYQISAEMVGQNLFLDEKVPAVPLWEMREHTFILLKKEGSDLHQRGIDICRNAGFVPIVDQQLDQVLTAYYMAASGAGVTFFRSSLMNMVGGTKELVYYKVGDSLATRPIYFTQKKGRYETKAMRAFLDLVGTLPRLYRQ